MFRMEQSFYQQKITLMDRRLEIAIKAAIEASKRITKIYASSDFSVEMKEDHTPLTLADKESNKIIVKHLSKTQIPILSEEGKSIPWDVRKEWDQFWMVDPLDGTKEFIKRNGEFTVNIALIENGSPALGVIVVPVTGDLYYADKSGSYKCTAVLNKSSVLDFIIENSSLLPFVRNNSEFVVVGSRSHTNTDTDEYIQSLDTGGKPMKMISKGSSLKLCLVASGEADIYPRLGPTMEWDIAAGHAIAIFAGRTVTQIPSDKPVVYNKENLLNPWFVVK